MQPAPERNPATDVVQMIEPRRCLVIVSAAKPATSVPVPTGQQQLTFDKVHHRSKVLAQPLGPNHPYA
jgi:hypothetical protein